MSRLDRITLDPVVCHGKPVIRELRYPVADLLLQRLSTGERSIALHLPMLASIAAHYAPGDGALSGCPRLILLDELFAGVVIAYEEDVRAGLLEAMGY